MGRGPMMLAGVLALAACGRGDSATVSGDPLDSRTLSISTTSEGDVEAAREDAAAAAAQFSDAHVLGFLGMIDNSEIEAAKVARERGMSLQIREFARMMESEHTAFLHRTRELAREIDVAVDLPPAPELEQMHLDAMQVLGREPRGTEFDRAYLAGQVAAHDRMLELMRSAATLEERHPRLASHLQAGIAMVEQHRDRARGVLQALGDEVIAR